jgi:hypothetical protein
MLIDTYDLDIFTPPCEPGAERYSAVARLTVDISAVLPYLNATLRGAVFHRAANALTWKKGGHNIAFHPFEIATALEKAQTILKSECSPIGLMASPEGYPHVWARDSVITALGALLSPGHEICLRTSLLTLGGPAVGIGAIPNNVSVATGRLDHTNAGSVDSNLWFILGHVFQYRVSGDAAFLQISGRRWKRRCSGCATRTPTAAACWKCTKRPTGPTCWPIASTSFMTTCCGMRRCAAWPKWRRQQGVMAPVTADMADDVRHKIRIVLWVGPENEAEWGPNCPGHTEWTHTLSQVGPVLVKRPFFLPYVAFRDFGDYCDVFGNLLAILFDVANPRPRKNASWIICTR